MHETLFRRVFGIPGAGGLMKSTHESATGPWSLKEKSITRLITADGGVRLLKDGPNPPLTRADFRPTLTRAEQERATRAAEQERARDAVVISSDSESS